MVCAGWLPIARHHLFATLHTKEGYPRASRSISDFARVVRESPGVGHAVTSLVVDSFRSDSKLSFIDLASSLQWLPRLRHLSLNNLRVPNVLNVAKLVSSPRSLQCLEINNVGFYLDNPANFFKLLHLFGNVGELKIERLWFRYVYGASHKDIIPTIPIPSHLSATTLTLHCADDRTELLLESLRHTRILDTLDALYISFYDFTPLVPTVARFLADPRCHIGRLAFDFCRGFPYAFWSDKSGLIAAQNAVEQVLRRSLPALSSLHTFALHLGNIPPGVSAFWDLCLTILHVLPQSVAELHVHVVNGQFGFDVPVLGRAVRRYDGLECVVIHGLGEDRMREEVRRGLTGVGKVGVAFVDS